MHRRSVSCVNRKSCSLQQVASRTHSAHSRGSLWKPVDPALAPHPASSPEWRLALTQTKPVRLSPIGLERENNVASFGLRRKSDVAYSVLQVGQYSYESWQFMAVRVSRFTNWQLRFFAHALLVVKRKWAVGEVLKVGYNGPP